MLVNVFYNMNTGALLQSVVLTLGLLFLILLDYNRLIQFFIKTKSNLPSLTFSKPLSKNVIRLSAIILSLLFTVYIRMLLK